MRIKAGTVTSDYCLTNLKGLSKFLIEGNQKRIGRRNFFELVFDEEMIMPIDVNHGELASLYGTYVIEKIRAIIFSTIYLNRCFNLCG